MKHSVMPPASKTHTADCGSFPSPERALLLYCCQHYVHPDQPYQFAQMMSQQIDWQRLLDIAANHCLMPLLYTQLPQLCPHLIPNWVRQDLKAQFHANLQQNLVLTAELLKVAKLLQQEKISVIALKGSTLAQLAYGNLAHRQFLDIDLWVPKVQILCACQILVCLGYQPQFALTSSQQARYLNIRDALGLWHPAEQIQIDLHGGLLPRQFSFAASIQNMSYETVQFANERLLTLAKPHLLRYLCWHGAKHNWSHLSWICDIAVLIQRYSDPDWQMVTQLSGQICTDRMLYLGLNLVQGLLGVDLPREIAQKISSDPQIDKIANQVKYNLWTDAQRNPSNNTIYLQTMESWRDRWFFRWDQICTPTPLEWRILPLPPWLYPLYYLIRLLRLLLKHFMLSFR